MADEGLHVEVDRGSTPPVVTVVGEVDMSTAPDLRVHLVGLIDEGATELVIDLAGLQFLDSTGIGVLLGAVKRGATVRLRNVPAGSRRIFEVTGLTGVFDMDG